MVVAHTINVQHEVACDCPVANSSAVDVVSFSSSFPSSFRRRSPSCGLFSSTTTSSLPVLVSSALAASWMCKILLPMVSSTMMRNLCLYMSATGPSIDRREDLVKISKTWTARHGGTA